jgi:hypothetical protein
MLEARAMAFFHADSLDMSYGFAERFAGPNGHNATLPEIITARANQPEESYIWRNWFTTASSEFYGHSRGGVPIIIVAHGAGPMVGMTDIQEAYKPRKFRDDGRPDDNGEGRISVDDFRLLENGHFGEVTIVEVAKVAEVYPYPFISSADMRQAEQDPLLQARLGPDWQKALEVMLNETKREGLEYSGDMPKVVQNQGPVQYHVDWASEGWPYGFLLSLSTVSHIHASWSDGGQYIGFDVDVHDRWNSHRFIGVRPGGNVIDTHPGPSRLDYNKDKLLLPNPMPPGVMGFFVLKQYGNNWFTQVPKTGWSMDTGWPEYPVKELEIVGASGKIVALDETMFFRYDIEQVINQAPDGANAYYVSSDLQRTRVGDDDAIEAEVVFCRISLDETQKVPAEEVLKTDYALQMELLERLEK